MDLHSITLPGAIGDLHFEVGSFTGLDRLLFLLPERLQLEYVARRIVRDLTARGAKFDRQLTFRMPNGTGPGEGGRGPLGEGGRGGRGRAARGPLVKVGKGSRQRSVTVRLWRVKT